MSSARQEMIMSALRRVCKCTEAHALVCVVSSLYIQVIER